jgi:hypothetical protein
MPVFVWARTRARYARARDARDVHARDAHARCARHGAHLAPFVVGGGYGVAADASLMRRRRCSSSLEISASMSEVSGTHGVTTAADAAAGGEARGVTSASKSAPTSPCLPRKASWFALEVSLEKPVSSPRRRTHRLGVVLTLRVFALPHAGLTHALAHVLHRREGQLAPPHREKRRSQDHVHRAPSHDSELAA